MRFGSVDLFLSSNPEDLRIGRRVANHEFLKALLTYGTFEAYHFFLPSLAHLEAFRRQLSAILPEVSLRNRVHPTILPALKEVIADHRFTVFHHGDFTRHLPYLAALRDRRAKNRFPLTGLTHSLNTYLMAQRYLQLALANLAPFDAIVCTSKAGFRVVRKGYEQMRSRLEGLLGVDCPLNARLEQIPLGIESACFEPPGRAEARAHLNLPAQDFLVLIVGRISSHSKMDLLPLLYAMAHEWRRDRLSRMKFVVAGGAEAASLAELKRRLAEMEISEHIIFKPNFQPKDKVPLYASANAFLSLSDNTQETFGLSVVEAMAAGTLPIVSDFNGYKDLVEHRKTGFRIPTLWSPPAKALDGLDSFLGGGWSFYQAQATAVDLEALIDCFHFITRNPGKSHELAEAARKAAAQYHWSAIIPRYEALWRELATLSEREVSPPPRTLHPLEADLSAIFSHYPTGALNPDTPLIPTEALKHSYLYRSTLPEPLPDMAPLLHRPLLDGILNVIQQRPHTLGDISEVMPDYGEDIIAYHAAWLIKYGLVRPALWPGLDEET